MNVVKDGSSRMLLIDESKLNHELNKAPVWTSLSVKETVDEIAFIYRHAHWVKYKSSEKDSYNCECSACRIPIFIPFRKGRTPYRFCPHCGAYMKGIIDEQKD